MHFVFHVGMGKTGTTAIQTALRASEDVLRDHGICYLGQWLGFIRSDFDGFNGFQQFLRQGVSEFEGHANRLCEHSAHVSKATGARRFLVSNEQYLENIGHLASFFRTLQQLASLEVIIYVRSPAHWLPSAVTQWGIVHKTYPGPVRPFSVTARALMGQYAFIRQWREILGPAVVVRKYDEGADVADDFLRSQSIAMTANVPREQQRPSLADAVMRASFNTNIPVMALPEEYNNAVAAPNPSFPAGLSGKLKHLFDYNDLSSILNENAETLHYIENEFGLRLTDDPQLPAEPVASEVLMDELLGRLIDVVSQQALQLRSLRERFETLESHQPR